MAEPVGFEGANDVLRAPPGAEGECHDLPIFRTSSGVISSWRLSADEVSEVIETGVVWFMSQGVTHPPVFISGQALVEVDGRPSKAEPAGLTRPHADKK